MKRAILVGAVAFLLGAAASPRAANDRETLDLLCKRFEAQAATTLSAHATMMGVDAKTGMVVNEDARRARAESNIAVVESLTAVRRVFCAK